MSRSTIFAPRGRWLAATLLLTLLAGCGPAKVVVEGNQAIRLVEIVTPDNQTAYFAFRLKLQQQGDYAGMWLTESVWPLQDPDGDKLAL